MGRTTHGWVVGGAVRVRQDIWSLSDSDPWHPTISWYEYAFRQLRDNVDTSDPFSLEAIANIHGTNTDPADWPAAVGPSTWNACQHFSWYFLPWHRMYLHYYETILRTFIDAAQGPADWALPFWDYDPARPETLGLPPAFLQPQRPDGGDNALYRNERALSILDGDPVPDGDVDLSGWPDLFTSSSIFVPMFGGPKTGWSHFGDAVGHVEGVPHGTVHVDVGGPGGLMSAFETAGQDAIFWLHHANIDRLWEVWRNQPGHADPPDDEWQNVAFEFGFGDAQTTLAVPRSSTRRPARSSTSTKASRCSCRRRPVEGSPWTQDSSHPRTWSRRSSARRSRRCRSGETARRSRSGWSRRVRWASTRRARSTSMSCFRT